MLPQSSLSTLATVLVAAGLASAIPAPAPPRVKGGTGKFSVNQVRNNVYVPHGPSALAKAYAKYGVAIPESLKAAVARYRKQPRAVKRVFGNVTTTPVKYDVEYLTPVTIGTPGQTLNLDFDSGSSDLWVFSTELGDTGDHAVYDPKKSSTSKAVKGAGWKISYGDGSSASGNVCTDVVDIGGVTFKTQAVETASEVSDEFVQDGSDGLLGLAFSSINTVTPKPQKTFFDNVMSSLDAPVFTADLRHDEPGTYSFGFIDDSFGDITYTDIDNSDGFWMFTSSGYGVGDGDFSESSSSGIADTGTTLLLLDDEIVNAYYKQVDGAKNDSQQGGYVFTCDTDLPSFSIGIEDTKVEIPGEYINFAPVDESGESCFGGIQSNSGIGFAIYGDVALKAAYVVFNGEKNQLGWAAKSSSSGGEAPEE